MCQWTGWYQWKDGKLPKKVTKMYETRGQGVIGHDTQGGRRGTEKWGNEPSFKGRGVLLCRITVWATPFLKKCNKEGRSRTEEDTWRVHKAVDPGTKLLLYSHVNNSDRLSWTGFIGLKTRQPDKAIEWLACYLACSWILCLCMSRVRLHSLLTGCSP